MVDAEQRPGGGQVASGAARPSLGRLVLVALLAAVAIGASLALAVSKADQRRATMRAEARAAEGASPAEGPSPAGGPGRLTPVTADAGADGPGTGDGAIDAAVAPAAPVATSPEGRSSLTMAFAGDLLPHDPLNAAAARYGAANGRAYDYAPMLAPMAPIIGGADVAICHMEVPLAPPGEAISTYPSFGAPAELVDGVRSAGYDGCSNASNHSLDRGRDGIDSTIARFELDGLNHAGTARTEPEANTITTYQVDGVEIAHLSYAYDFNGYKIPADAPWSVTQIDPDRIRADTARARGEGADLVVVSLHWGTEYDSAPSEYQRDIISRILPSPDIDLVIGHHAHVVQPIEQIAGTFVVFGLGNQLSNMTQGPRRDGLTVQATATRAGDRWSFTGIEAIPTYVDLDTFEVLPVAETLARPDISGSLRTQLDESYARTVGIVLGGRAPGLTIDQPR